MIKMTDVALLEEFKLYLKEHEIELPKKITDDDLRDIIETTESLRKRLEERKERARNKGSEIAKPSGAKPPSKVSGQPLLPVPERTSKRNFGKGV